MQKRLDVFLTENNLASSRTKAQNLVLDGLVFVDGIQASKPSQTIKDGQQVQIKQHFSFVSRGALKLEHALNVFDINLNEKVVLDIGASTGGFSQVSLLHGAKKVYAVDIGKSELDQSLRQNPKVKNICGTDIRKLNKNQVEDFDFFTCDLSFVSLTKILPQIFQNLGKKEGIFLFKPQFECGKQIAKKFKGVIKDKKIHYEILSQFLCFLKSCDITLSGLVPSPIKGGDGNIEYLFYLNGQKSVSINLKDLVDKAFQNN